MPRTADPKLGGRILKAAHRLWTKGGEHALTMRAVAKSARTTTPTVYERFRNRQEIVHALCIETRRKLFAILKESSSPREACEMYLRFAACNPREYELLVAGWMKPPVSGDEWPSFTLLKQRVAQRLGGRPRDHERIALALWALLHGTASLTILGKSKWLHDSMRDACLHAVELLGMSSPKRKNGNR